MPKETPSASLYIYKEHSKRRLGPEVSTYACYRNESNSWFLQTCRNLTIWKFFYWSSKES